MKDIPLKTFKGRKRYVLLTITAVIFIFASASFWMCYQTLKAEAYARYMGVRNVSAEKIAKIIRGVEMNALNIFDEVEKHHETSEDVIGALEKKANLNYDVRGYFAAFVPDFYPEKGRWFEPYIYQPEQGGFEYRQVGSARHNYFKSPWYVQAKSTGKSFWSKPYYYYDGTSMSGHYTTFVKPIYNNMGQLVCVCGADMKFEWLKKELEWVDNASRNNKLLNKYHSITDFHFYSIILNNDGTCIAYPGDKPIVITDNNVLKDLQANTGGVTDVIINGEECTLYYGPIEFVDWAIAVVVPKWDMVKPMLPYALVFMVIALVSIIIVWLELRMK